MQITSRNQNTTKITKRYLVASGFQQPQIGRNNNQIRSRNRIPHIPGVDITHQNAKSIGGIQGLSFNKSLVEKKSFSRRSNYSLLQQPNALLNNTADSG